MKKSLFFWLYFVASIILAIYFASRIIMNLMGRGPVSHVNNIQIISDSKEFDPTPIKMAIGITRGTNVRSLDLNSINRHIMAIPGTEKSATRLLPNGNLIIKIKKYNIVATLYDGLSYYPLSANGKKIDTPLEQRNENTLVFQGDLPDDLTEIINNVSVLSNDIDYLAMVESRRWNIYTKNGIVIYLPEDNPSVAINKINMLNQTHKLLSRNIGIIDMRDTARILVQTKK